ncbi:hypothetical protein NI17_002265 [Thermobifida halotolerans]|uniref:Peptidoglycan binding-like domain-containing protein n=1 Tax=Thermobifida halotolerans TaxID=483545 RepID=A0AA97LXZ1_9ACTN|nr:hypothetical protein [Thermobifida halotolerans]UOE20094.1 hypothetical protein NI17_002265 [Thermobifida halotolerans]
MLVMVHPGCHGVVRAPRRTSPWSGPAGRRLRDMLFFVTGVLGALFDAERVLPEADPGQVHALLVELGRLAPAAAPAERVAVLREFQTERGLPGNGVADGPTVTALMRDVRARRERRALGLPDDVG